MKLPVWFSPTTPEIDKRLRGFLRRVELTDKELLDLLYQVEQIVAYMGRTPFALLYVENLLRNQGWESAPEQLKPEEPKPGN